MGGTVLSWTPEPVQLVIGCVSGSAEEIDKNKNRNGNTQQPEERQGDPAKEAFAIFSRISSGR